MKQGVKQKSEKNISKKKSVNKGKKSFFYKKKVHTQPYGTSKLEEDFAREFLDKLNIRYIYQFEAKEIKRFYDFYLPDSNLLIEIDGDYYHSNPLIYEGKKLNRMQIRNKKIDEYKNKWALMNCIPIMRIWEYDIRNNPEKVITMLKERLYIEDKKQETLNNKKKRHVNIINKPLKQNKKD